MRSSPKRVAAGRRTRVVALLAGVTTLAACSSGLHLDTNSTSLPFSLGSRSTGSTGSSCNNGIEPQGTPVAKIRVANFYASGGEPSGPIDLYDTPRPCPGDKPLIAGLAYGQLSSYVSPRSDADYGNLYVFPAGSQVHAAPVIGMQGGTNISNAGWKKGDRQTVVIGVDNSTGTPTTSFQTIDESGNESGSPPILTSVPSGQGLLVVNAFGVVHTNSDPDADLSIDGACPSPVDPSTGQPTSSDLPGNVIAGLQNFLVAPGSHTLGFVNEPAPGQAFTQAQCAAASPASTTSVPVSAASTQLVLLYGPSQQSVKFLTASIGS
ncbi:MAG TPA: hypothetical protein VMU09_06225 [Acidimicrobiales bacterium]|nr:hypothetical protein [Acidimicrobiales bacterium]